MTYSLRTYRRRSLIVGLEIASDTNKQKLRCSISTAKLVVLLVFVQWWASPRLSTRTRTDTGLPQKGSETFIVSCMHAILRAPLFLDDKYCPVVSAPGFGAAQISHRLLEDGFSTKKQTGHIQHPCPLWKSGSTPDKKNNIQPVK